MHSTKPRNKIVTLFAVELGMMTTPHRTDRTNSFAPRTKPIVVPQPSLAVGRKCVSLLPGTPSLFRSFQTSPPSFSSLPEIPIHCRVSFHLVILSLVTSFSTLPTICSVLVRWCVWYLPHLGRTRQDLFNQHHLSLSKDNRATVRVARLQQSWVSQKRTGF
jgi:hypothetical protein